MCHHTFGFAWSTGNVPDLEQLWLKGIGLILSNKSDVEIQNLLCRMCSIIQDSVTSTDNALDR